MKKYFHAAATIVNRLRVGGTVVVQSPRRYIVGSAVLGLVQILVDPYYSTLQGFCALIEKEFLYER